MRSRIAFAAVLLAYGASLAAQQGNVVLRQFSGAPTGSCSAIQVALNTLSGDYYDCLSGSWNKVGPSAGGSGTVTSVSGLSPLFTVTNPTTTPTFVLSNAADKTFLGNHSGSAAPPSYIQPAYSDLSGTPQLAQTKTCTSTDKFSAFDATTGLFTCTADAGGGGGASTADSFVTMAHDADLTGERVLTGTSGDITITDGGANGNVTLDTGTNIPKITTSNTYSASTTQDFDTAVAKYWTAAPIFMADQYAGVDMCAKIAAVLSDAAYTSASMAIIDARGFTGSQNCASNPFGATKPTKYIFGPVNISLTVAVQTNGAATSIAAPSAPGLSTSTSGGSLAASTQFGIKVNYANINSTSNGTAAGSLPSSEATITTGAGATNSITVTSPAASFGATCYNVFSATPIGSGWKLNNTTGCIPLGTNYVIKTVGAGAVPPASGSAYNGMIEIEGAGESTIWSFDSTTATMLCAVDHGACYIHDLMIVNNLTTNVQLASLYTNSNVNNVIFRNITCQGGNHCVLFNDGTNYVADNIRCSNPTISSSCVAQIGPTSNVRITNVRMKDSVWPTGGNLQGAVKLDNCTDCTVDGVVARNLDLSNITNGAAISVQNSLRVNIANVECTSLVNSDCVAVLSFSKDTNVNNVHCFGTNVGTGAGVGSNSNNGDCLDFLQANRVNASNVVAQDLGLVGGLRFPCFEFYQSNEITATNITCNGSTGEGVNMFGCTGCTIANSHLNLNGKSGVLIQDGTATVSCNGTTTVTQTSGFPFGPWPIGTPVTINGVAHTVGAVPTSSTSLTTAAACTSGAGQAFVISTQDTNLSNNQMDDNGTAAVGATSCSGIDILGGSSVTVNGGSANDNRPTASKTQCWGIDSSGATATFSAVNFDPSGNKTGTISDTAGKGVYARNTGDGTYMIAGLKVVTADFTTAANTNLQTITGLVFTLPALTAARYAIDCHLIYSQATAGAANSGFGFQSATISPTNAWATGLMQTGTSAFTGGAVATLTTTTATNIVVSTPTVTTNWMTDLHILINNPSNASANAINIMVKTGTAADTMTVRKDSFCVLQGTK